MYRILKARSGKLVAECQIQDGTERAEFTNVVEAEQWLIRSARVLNDDYIHAENIERQDMVIVNTPPPSQEEQLLLERIRRREPFVLPFDDKRLRYNITGADFELIVQIREGDVIARPK